MIAAVKEGVLQALKENADISAELVGGAVTTRAAGKVSHPLLVQTRCKAVKVVLENGATVRNDDDGVDVDDDDDDGRIDDGTDDEETEQAMLAQRRPVNFSKSNDMFTTEAALFRCRLVFNSSQHRTCALRREFRSEIFGPVHHLRMRNTIRTYVPLSLRPINLRRIENIAMRILSQYRVIRQTMVLSYILRTSDSQFRYFSASPFTSIFPSEQNSLAFGVDESLSEKRDSVRAALSEASAHNFQSDFIANLSLRSRSVSFVPCSLVIDSFCFAE